MAYFLWQFYILFQLHCISICGFRSVILELLLLRLIDYFQHHWCSLVQEFLQFNVTQIYVLLLSKSHNLRFLLMFLVSC